MKQKPKKSRKRKFVRFKNAHHKMRERLGDSHIVKVILAAIGAVFVLLGFIMLFIPGPGILFIIIGFIFLSALSHRLAHYFDSLEKRIIHWLKDRRKK